MTVNIPVPFFACALAALSVGAACHPGSGQAQQAAAPDTTVQPPADTSAQTYHAAVMHRYKLARLADSGLDSTVFYTAYTGYLNLKAGGKTSSGKLAIVDFHLPSTADRIWIIDTDRDSLLLSTWCAHGKGSGKEMATAFSNTPGSLQTSLGFYLTAEEYVGKNGRSMKLDGLDSGFNTHARKRYVVMHGADYVSRDTIQVYGHLGNSEGCPAVSHDVNHQVIDWMKGKGVLFITGPSKEYRSKWLNEEVAWGRLVASATE